MTPMTEIVPGLDNRQLVIFAKDQPEYSPLPAIMSEGVVTTRWHLTWRERLSLFIGGSIWLQISTHGKRLQPVKLCVDCPIEMYAEGEIFP